MIFHRPRSFIKNKIIMQKFITINGIQINAEHAKTLDFEKFMKHHKHLGIDEKRLSKIWQAVEKLKENGNNQQVFGYKESAEPIETVRPARTAKKSNKRK